MVKFNSNFSLLKSEYIFPIIERKVIELKQKLPANEILNLGVGDIALPLAPSIGIAIQNASIEMTEKVIGYGPAEGYEFLRSKIADFEYKGLEVSKEEIFISDGINSDATNLLDLFSSDATIGIIDPTYPAYKQAAILSGRKVISIPCVEENYFLPIVPKDLCDVIYLCSPNNPTGVAMTRENLKSFIDYAKENGSVLIYDNAYSDFITTRDTPRSIYEIPGAHEVAIELRSFSKSAGFTGLRCAYAVVPKKLTSLHLQETISLHTLWKKRQNIKFNGLAYPIQKGAEVFFTELGRKETSSQIDVYKEVGTYLYENLTKMGFRVFGGKNAPYIWWKTPSGMDSWEFFDLLLEKCQLIGIPGKGFGEYGEGYLRLSCFTTVENAKKAIERIASCVLP